VDPAAIPYRMAFGTYDDARAMIGQRTPPRRATAPINEAMIRYFASMVEDPNPSYWDRDWATGAWGGVPSPPAMLITWVMEPPWVPGGRQPEPMLMLQVPLPGRSVLNVSNDTEIRRPARAGEVLAVVEELLDVSEAKRTKVGKGHFVTTAADFSTADGGPVARFTNVLFRFDPT
jgi:hypothetical protein